MSTPGEPIFQQAAQKLSHIIPSVVWMKPAAKRKLRATESAFIVALIQNLSSGLPLRRWLSK